MQQTAGNLKKSRASQEHPIPKSKNKDFLKSELHNDYSVVSNMLGVGDRGEFWLDRDMVLLPLKDPVLSCFWACPTIVLHSACGVCASRQRKPSAIPSFNS